MHLCGVSFLVKRGNRILSCFSMILNNSTMFVFQILKIPSLYPFLFLMRRNSQVSQQLRSHQSFVTTCWTVMTDTPSAVENWYLWLILILIFVKCLDIYGLSRQKEWTQCHGMQQEGGRKRRDPEQRDDGGGSFCGITPSNGMINILFSENQKKKKIIFKYLREF